MARYISATGCKGEPQPAARPSHNDMGVFRGGPLLKTDIPKGSVATHLRCGVIFSDGIITNVLLI